MIQVFLLLAVFASAEDLCSAHGVVVDSVSRAICESTAEVCEVHIVKGTVNGQYVQTGNEYCNALGMDCLEQWHDDNTWCGKGPQYDSCDIPDGGTSDHIIRCGHSAASEPYVWDGWANHAGNYIDRHESGYVDTAVIECDGEMEYSYVYNQQNGIAYEAGSGLPLGDRAYQNSDPNYSFEDGWWWRPWARPGTWEFIRFVEGDRYEIRLFCDDHPDCHHTSPEGSANYYCSGLTDPRVPEVCEAEVDLVQISYQGASTTASSWYTSSPSFSQDGAQIHDGKWDGDNVLDGDLTTAWDGCCSGWPHQTLTITLAEAETALRYSINTQAGECPKSWTVVDDAGNTIDTVSGESCHSMEDVFYDIDAPSSSRTYTFVFTQGDTGTGNNNGYRIRTLNLYKAETVDPCAEIVCQHEGVCVDGTCNCVAGFDGTNCENNINECSAVDCQNGGACNDGVDSYSCNCVAGFDGTHCEVNINDCEGVVCQNSGVCVDGDNSYSCDCTDGFEGLHCEVNINECEGVVCQNSGACVDEINGYSCNCLPGFEGTHCESNIDECLEINCQNGGVCIDGINEYTCDCDDGFAGAHCEFDINECDTAVCYNGGTCVDQINGHECLCEREFWGKDCSSTYILQEDTNKICEDSIVDTFVADLDSCTELCSNNELCEYFSTTENTKNYLCRLSRNCDETNSRDSEAVLYKKIRVTNIGPAVGSANSDIFTHGSAGHIAVLVSVLAFIMLGFSYLRREKSQEYKALIEAEV